MKLRERERVENIRSIVTKWDKEVPTDSAVGRNTAGSFCVRPRSVRNFRMVVSMYLLKEDDRGKGLFSSARHLLSPCLLFDLPSVLVNLTSKGWPDPYFLMGIYNIFLLGHTFKTRSFDTCRNLRVTLVSLASKFSIRESEILCIFVVSRLSRNWAISRTINRSTYSCFVYTTSSRITNFVCFTISSTN